jgi:hypothetical protein
MDKMIQKNTKASASISDFECQKRPMPIQKTQGIAISKINKNYPKNQCLLDKFQKPKLNAKFEFLHDGLVKGYI